MFLNKKYS